MNRRRPYYNLGTAPPSKGKEGYINKGEEASGAVPRLFAFSLVLIIITMITVISTFPLNLNNP